MIFSKKRVIILAAMCAVTAPTIDSRGVFALDDSEPIEPTWEKLELGHTILDEPEMPILAYITMPRANASDGDRVGENPSYINYSTFKLYQDAGFNIVCPMYSSEPEGTPYVVKEIEICNELGLGYLVRDLRVRASSDRGTVNPGKEYFKSVLQGDAAWYLKEPCVVGVQVIDEPNYLDLEPIGDFYHALAEVDNTKVGFTNLFPDGASAQQLAMEDIAAEIGLWEAYKQYATHFLDTTGSNYVLYDKYWNHTAQSPLNKDTTASLFRSFSFYANLARERGVVFWSAVASWRHGARKEFTPKETRWTTNVSLAYGSKGIEYYTYWPIISGVKEEDWEDPSRRGLVTEGGIPHDTYYTIQDINRNIQAVDEYLMPATFKGVHQYGEEVAGLQECDIIHNPKSIADVKGGNGLMGIFENEGKDLYYIVNNSIDCGLTPFTVSFPKKAKVHMVNSKMDKELDSVYAAGFSLSAGEAILLEVEL